jgi:hypothetical protein
MMMCRPVDAKNENESFFFFLCPRQGTCVPTNDEVKDKQKHALVKLPP